MKLLGYFITSKVMQSHQIKHSVYVMLSHNHIHTTSPLLTKFHNISP